MKTEELDSLNISVIKALNLLKDYKLPKINLKKYNFPIVVGSGNAYNAGQIIFSRQKAIFANESNALAILQLYKKLIKNKVISEAVIISASGEKDSIWEIKAAKKMGLKTILFSCSPNSSAANVSTYLSMISAAFPENIDTLISFILKLKIPQKFKQYQAYSFILPDQFNAIAPMLDIKKSELFGPHLSLRAFSFGEARHAKFVIRDQNELVISFGKNKYFGATKSRWEININKNFGPGAIMALSYFLIGLIQEAKSDYFRENITPFCRDYGYKAYPKSKAFPVIVPGNIE
jgi:hypothetical protein